MNKTLLLPVLLLLGSFWLSCKKASEPLALVPKTVDQDANLPHISVNNTLLHAEAFGNAAHPMLIFLHGGPGGDYRNAMNVQQLADDGYYVIFYDQRGSGLSRRHPQQVYSIQQVLNDLTAVIAHYRTSASQKVFLFGHSWGAMVAAAYINRYPDRIAGAIFAEAGGFNKALLDEYGQSSRSLRLFAEETNDVLYYEQILTGNENAHEQLDYKAAVQTSFSYAKGNTEGIEGPSPFWRNGAVVLRAFTDIADKEGFDFTTNLNAYSTPVLFLYGSNNRSYGLSFAQKEAAFFPHASIAAIEGTGHEMIYFKWNLVHHIVLNYLHPLR